MAVDTSVPLWVQGPRTPYALYPELASDPNCEHKDKGFMWRAGYKRSTDPLGRYTSEYQRQYQPISEEGQKELANLRRQRRERHSAPVADVREVMREVQSEAPHVPEKPVEVVGGQKRAANKSKKRGAKRPRKEHSLPFPISEYQAQFLAWDRLVRENTRTSPTPVQSTKKLTPHAALPPSYSLQRSPRRWSSEYSSNYSLRSSDVTEETSPWYQMVTELRERARAYRDRGRSSTMETFQLPLSRRLSEVSSPPTAERSPDRDTRDSATQVSVRPREQQSAVEQLRGSLSTLNVSVPPNDQLIENPKRSVSNTSARATENHDCTTHVPQEAVRARIAVPPIDINRLKSYSSPSYQSAPISRSALPETDPSSLQTQLFRYKEGAPVLDSDQESVASNESLASQTLERARHRQTFWK